jgi:spore germination cell wall hydrolase CwlJ-like protein
VKLHSPVRADARALAGAVALGSAMGLVLGAAYLAGGAARAAASHARTAQLAQAASNGFSDTALKAEAASMEPGALAVARRHDPFTAAGSAERDRQAAVLAARLEPSQTPAHVSAPSAQPAVLRASYQRPTAPARPFHMAGTNALDGARELDCLSEAVYYEARGESKDGQAAVAQVVLNRVRHPSFPKSVCAVVFQGAQSHNCQFSFACNGAMHDSKEEAAWRRAQAVAARALGGFVMTEVGNATHFHVAKLGGLWGANLLKVAQVGSHIFYKFSGHAGAPDSFHATPDLYVPPSELVDHPVYARAGRGAQTADGGAQPTLILASAVTTAPTPAAVSGSSTGDAGRSTAGIAVSTDKAAPAADRPMATSLR